jgi:hypothetical protein
VRVLFDNTLVYVSRQDVRVIGGWAARCHPAPAPGNVVFFNKQT